MLSVDERIRSFEPFWGEWRIKDVIGRGSFGQVYAIVRENFGQVYESALKYVSIPRDEAALEEGYRNGSYATEKQAESYYIQIATKLVNEINLMYALQGYTHIVNYQEHQFIKKANGPGYDCFIRMEKLVPLPKLILQKGGLTQEDILKIGLDICDALKTVHTNKILHRDIKPENLFYGKGEYKLGDFGIARSLDNTVNVTATGTPNYMAPEVYRYEPVNHTADLYSLGIMLYRLMNGNRAPFLPADRNIPITPAQEEAAIGRRIRGEPLPPLPWVDHQLMQAVLKACAFHPEDRYQSASEMARALLRCELLPQPAPSPIPQPVPQPIPQPTEDPYSYSTIIVPPVDKTERTLPALFETKPPSADSAKKGQTAPNKPVNPTPAPIAPTGQNRGISPSSSPLSTPAVPVPKAKLPIRSTPATPAPTSPQPTKTAAPSLWQRLLSLPALFRLPEKKEKPVKPAKTARSAQQSTKPVQQNVRPAPQGIRPARQSVRPVKQNTKSKPAFRIPLPALGFGKKNPKTEVVYVNGAWTSVPKSRKKKKAPPATFGWQTSGSWDNDWLNDSSGFFGQPSSGWGQNDASGWNIDFSAENDWMTPASTTASAPENKQPSGRGKQKKSKAAPPVSDDWGDFSF